VRTCLADNSTAERDLLAGGFNATARENEIRCQGAQASVLMDTEDVTANVTGALAGVAGADLARRRNETLTNLESACEAESKQMELATLLDDRMMERHGAEERKLREAVTADPKLKRELGTRGTRSRAPRRSTATSSSLTP
jgi:hypothetical protein